MTEMTPEEIAQDIVGKWGYEEEYWWRPIAVAIQAQRADAARVERDKFKRLWEALRPFYGFGTVLKTANEEKGYAWVNFYDGQPEPTEAEVDGHPETEMTYDSLDPDGWIVGVHASWDAFPGTYMGPVLRAKDFFAAEEAFMSITEFIEAERGDRQEGGKTE